MHPAIVTAILVIALAVVVVVTTVHVVPTGSRALVMRWGLVSRVAGPGLVRVVPGLDRVRVLDMQQHRLEPVPVTATTRDGVDVRVDLSVLWQLVEPERSLRAVPDVATATADAVEHTARQSLGETTLRTLVEERTAALADVDARSSAAAREWGATVLDVDVLDVEVRAGPALVRLLG
jgi:regulator of protease activity HflC (stomatin/prohibitin superfamily)